jgi:hypothetical protein
LDTSADIELFCSGELGPVGPSWSDTAGGLLFKRTSTFHETSLFAFTSAEIVFGVLGLVTWSFFASHLFIHDWALNARSLDWHVWSRLSADISGDAHGLNDCGATVVLVLTARSGLESSFARVQSHFWDDFLDARLDWDHSGFLSDLNLISNTFVRNLVVTDFSVVSRVSGNASVVNGVSDPLPLADIDLLWSVEVSGNGSSRSVFLVQVVTVAGMVVFGSSVDLIVLISKVSVGVSSSGSVAW